MEIVIFGAEKIGTYLADVLSKEKHSVTLLDPDIRSLLEFSQNADVATLCTSGINLNILKEANPNKNAVFLAMSSNDGLNLSSCCLAKSLEYKKTIAKISELSLLNDDILDVKSLFHIDHLLASDILIAHELFKHIINPKIKLIENFAHGQIQMQTHLVPKGWAYINHALSEVPFREEFLVALIKRKATSKSSEDIEVIYPRGDTKLCEDDEVTFIGKCESMPKLLKLFNLSEKTVSSATICGTTNAVKYLSHLLHEKNIQIKIIESNHSLCEILAKELPFATIINHKEEDKDFLIEENITQSDIFIACSQSTEKNLLIATLAQEIGAKDIITLIADETYIYLLNKLDISYALSEKITLSKHVFSFIYEEIISSITSLYHNHVKVLEVKITQNSPLSKMEISDIANKIPKKCVLGFTIHGGKVTLAKGHEILNPGDFLIIFIAPDQIDNFQKLL